MKSLANGSYFVTGTDTDCGKTFVTSQLLQLAAETGKSSLGLKPIAAGGLEDVLALQSASTVKLPKEAINPFYLSEPLSPHLAAAIDGVSLSVVDTITAIKPYLHKADICLLEGAGGIYVPINAQETILDLMQALQLPVILVVGLRLGCLNHAQLSCQALKHAGLEIAGWVATQVDQNMQCYQENIETLKQSLGIPMLAQFNFVDHSYQNTEQLRCVEVGFS